jgi:hypothetical protein
MTREKAKARQKQVCWRIRGKFPECGSSRPMMVSRPVPTSLAPMPPILILLCICFLARG